MIEFWEKGMWWRPDLFALLSVFGWVKPLLVALTETISRSV